MLVKGPFIILGQRETTKLHVDQQESFFNLHKGPLSKTSKK